MASLTEMAIPRVRSSKAMKVAVLGSGNWGCAIAKIIARNCQRRAEFQKNVPMWVHEELIGESQRKLTEIINQDHENVKYLPGVELPHNLRLRRTPGLFSFRVATDELKSRASLRLLGTPNQMRGQRCRMRTSWFSCSRISSSLPC